MAFFSKIRGFFRPKLLVFLAPKIISTDAVLPLVYEVKARYPKVRVTFYVPNDSWPDGSYDNEEGSRTWGVLQKNETLWQAMCHVGRVRVLRMYDDSGRSWLANRLVRLLILLRLTGACIFCGPLSMLFLFVPGSHFGRFVNSLGRKLGRTYEVESQKYMGSGFRQVEQQLNAGTGVDAQPFADASISFSPDHEQHMPYGERYLLGIPTLFPAWRDYCERESRDFFEEFYQQHPATRGLPVILYCVSIVDEQLGYGQEELRLGTGGMQHGFEEIMEALASVASQALIFLKPHYITNRAILDTHVRQAGNKNLFVTNVHPLVILPRATLQISCGFSTTLWDGKALGVTTVEYSDYSDKYLRLLNNKAFEPLATDYFVNNDKNALGKLLTGLTSGVLSADPDKGDFPCMDSRAIDLLGAG